MLAAYADFTTTVAATKLRGVLRLEKLATRFTGAGQDKLRDLAGVGYAHVAETLYRGGKSKLAQTNMAKARRLLKTVPVEIRHNSAVADYYAGRREDALKTLNAVVGKIPVALCNLGVHNEEDRAPTKAYELFGQCEQRGGRFPGLKAILEIKRQLWGGR